MAASRWGESVLLFVAAASSMLACLVATGVEFARWDAWAAALLAGLAAGAAWGVEHYVTVETVARELDRRLRHQGGLVTAFELEGGEARAYRSNDASTLAPMERLAVDRTLRRLRTREAVRALFPPLALPVAAPVVGVALLALALDRGRPNEATRAARFGEWGAGLSAAMTPARSAALAANEAGTLGSAETERALDAIREAAEFAQRIPQWRERPDEGRQELRELDAKLFDLGRRLPQLPENDELAQRLKEARSWLDAIGTGLEALERARRDRALAEGDPGDPGDRGDRGDRGESPRPDALAEGESPERAEAGPDSGPAVAGGDGMGTMSASAGAAHEPNAGAPGSTVETGERGGPALGEGPSLDRGTAASSWWPEAYDEVVRRWVAGSPESTPPGPSRPND